MAEPSTFRPYVLEMCERAETYLKQGNPAEAIAMCKEIIDLKPDCFAAFFLLAVGYRAQNQDAAALAAYDRALQLVPEAPRALAGKGELLARQGRTFEALDCFERAVKAEPRLAAAHWGLAKLHEQMGWIELAIPHYQRALALHPPLGSASVHTNLGNSLRERGDLDGAIACYRRALERQPGCAPALLQLGLALTQRGDLEEALDCFQRGVALAPDLFGPEQYRDLGAACVDLGKPEAAIAPLETALALDPNYLPALAALGYARFRLGEWDEALACYDRAIAQDADFAHAHSNMAFPLLMSGQWERGYAAFEYRWHGKHQGDIRPFPQPRWQGEPLAGKTLLVWGEQGVGDEILYSSLLPDLLDRCDRLVVECDPRLVPLLARSFPRIEVHPKDAIPPERLLAADIDYQIPIASLCRWLRPSHAAFRLGDRPLPPGKPGTAYPAYLHADAAKVAALRDRYAKLGRGLKVGISWHSTNAVKFPAPLADWEPILKCGKATFISVQYGDCDRDIARVSAALGVPIHRDRAIDAMASLDDAAAQLAALDLVIALSSTTAHLAGALGVPTWVLLPFVPVGWYWMREGEASLWYPSVRLYRQPTRGQWRAPIERMASDLRRSR